jgi:DNA-binding NarL/FixJ family response regulator
MPTSIDDTAFAAPTARSAGAPDGSLAETGAALAARPYARRGVSPTGDPIRVILADDHKLLRQGVKALLRNAPDIVVVGEATSGTEAVALAERQRPDVVVMDLDMSGGDGASATRTLAREAPSIRVLILTMYAEEERLLPLLSDGARGYLAKNTADTELVDAIRVVASGDVYVRPSVARLLASRVMQRTERRPDTAVERFATLSDREQTVLRLTAAGYNGPEIGEQLHITAKTVDTYKQRIEEKIGLSHRTEYVRFAMDAGLMLQVVARAGLRRSAAAGRCADTFLRP